MCVPGEWMTFQLSEDKEAVTLVSRNLDGPGGCFLFKIKMGRRGVGGEPARDRQADSPLFHIGSLSTW
jgi:hypothetical protein